MAFARAAGLGFVYEKQHDYAKSIDSYTKGGDTRSVARVRENLEIEQHNASADQHNDEIKRLEQERAELQEEMKALPGASSGPPRR